MTDDADVVADPESPAGADDTRSVLGRLGSRVARHARAILVVAAALVIIAGVLGLGAFHVLKNGGFDDPGSSSARALVAIDSRFGGQTNFVLLVRAHSGTVDATDVTVAGTRMAAEFAAEPTVTNVTSYWAGGQGELRSADGTMAVITGHVTGDDQQVVDRADILAGRYSGSRGPVSVTAGGDATANRDIHAEVNRSLLIAESVAVPVILILLVFAFGSLMAALVPLLIALVSIAGTFAELRLIGSVTDVSVFAINLTTALGLGLSVDYALLIVSRFRESLAETSDPSAAVVVTMRTAGRTIVFSAATVAAAIATLAIFPLYFLRSFAYAGMGVVLIAALAALTVAPAALCLLGNRVNAGRPGGTGSSRGPESPRWGRVAAFAMRHPASVALPVTAFLLLVASPLLGASFGTPDQGVLPDRSPSRQVADTIEARFAVNPAAVTDIVVLGPVTAPAVTSYALALSRLTGVAAVSASTGTFANGRAVTSAAENSLARPDAQRLSVATSPLPKSVPAQRLMRQIRAVPAPGGGTALSNSSTGRLMDTRHAIGSRLPLAGLLIACTTVLILFLFTGSVIQPIRALVLNGLSLSATLGLMVWIFQDGHLVSLLGFTPRPMDTSMTLLLLCIAFGLSMDYEVFVIGRISELHRQGADNRTAVTQGLARTGRIVSTAAALLAVSFFAFGTSSVSFLQMFGLGAGVAVLIDATLVRGLLVPAAMRVLGPAAWYAPGLLRRLYQRIGVRD